MLRERASRPHAVGWAGRALSSRGDAASLAAQGVPFAGSIIRLHGLVLLPYRYPLVTWIPVVLALNVVALASVVEWLGAAPDGVAVYDALWAGVALAVLSGAGFGLRLRAWTAAATARETDYGTLAELPTSGTPRLLPDPAANAPDPAAIVKSSHLVVHGETGALVWSGELRPSKSWRAVRRHRPGVSSPVGIWPQDSLDRLAVERRGGFDRPVSRPGRRSVKWRAYERHYFTKLQDPVIVPLAGGRLVAIAPYLRFRGFPVRRAYLAGVHVFHQDGRLEDLTMDEALMRREVAASGRLIPKLLALELARACGHVWQGLAADEGFSPYLTMFADGGARWVSVTCRRGDKKAVGAVVLTDSTTGATDVWRPPADVRLLSDYAAFQLVIGLPPAPGSSDPPDRRLYTPIPLFAQGRLYYLASVVTAMGDKRPPVVVTVLIDAAERRVVDTFGSHEREALRRRLTALGVSW